jgi:DNA-binding NarL/FixJ family response regulator
MALKSNEFKPFPSLATRSLATFARHTRDKLNQALAGLYGPLEDPIADTLRDAAASLTNLLYALAQTERSEIPNRLIDNANAPSKGRLTTREREVLQLLCIGYNNSQIANQLNYGVGTIKADVRAILEKLGARDRTQAAVIAVRRALI